MSRARPVYPGAVVFSTRRVHKRQLLLRPSPRLNQAIGYIVAVLTRRYDIRLHALCAMSNHTHDVGTDSRGQAVEFQRDFHALVARATNALHGDFESLWAREPTCRVTCVESEDVLDKIIYTMANPVEAGLVAHGKSWPGLRLAWPMKPRTFRRPAWFFRHQDQGGAWPEEATLELHRPPGYDDLSDDEFAALIGERIEVREAAARSAIQRAGRHFCGRRGVLAQSRYAYPTSNEDRFVTRPTLAAKSKWARIERLAQNTEWLACYERAKVRAKARDPDVVFPYGTWKMRLYHGYPCESPEPSRPPRDCSTC